MICPICKTTQLVIQNNNYYCPSCQIYIGSNNQEFTNKLTHQALQPVAQTKASATNDTKPPEAIINLEENPIIVLKRSRLIYLVIAIIIFALIRVSVLYKANYLNLFTKVGVNLSHLTKSTSSQPINDSKRDDYMGKIAFLIDKYYQDNNSLPTDLSQLDFSSIGINSDQTLSSYVQNELKYIPSNGIYLLCAKFTQNKDSLNTIYFRQKSDSNPAGPGYQCFLLAPFYKSISTTAVTDDTSGLPNITLSTMILDPHIDKVTSDALYTLKGYTTTYTLNGHSNEEINQAPGISQESGKGNFPNGLFSQNPQEWGLIAQVESPGQAATPIVAKVIFKVPVQLSSITNYFGNCQLVDCYSWQAAGIDTNNKLINLVPATIAGKDAKSPSIGIVGSNSLFKEVDITILRTDNTYDTTLVWKKLQFTYK